MNKKEQTMRLQAKVQKHASEKAVELFNRHRRSGTITGTSEAITQLAHTEAETFYQSGKILFLNISSLASKEAITEVYTQAFSEVYTKFKDHYQSVHPI
jgi:hypothetical protein